MATVIGTAKGGFLLSMSEMEIANLLGFYYGGAEHCPRIEPGMEIKINPMWMRLYTLRNSEGHINGLAQKLEHFAREIKAVVPLVWPEESEKREG